MRGLVLFLLLSLLVAKFGLGTVVLCLVLASLAIKLASRADRQAAARADRVD